MFTTNRFWAPLLVLLTAGLISCSGTTSQPSGSPAEVASNTEIDKSNPCALLTPQQVESAVGLKLSMREIVEENVCALEFQPPATGAEGGPAAQQPKQDDPEAMAKDFTVGASGGTPKITYTIHWEDGATVVTAAKLAGQMMGADSMTKLDGVGDEAYLGALASMLYLRVGDVGVEMDLRLLPEGRERGTRLAQQLAARLK